MSQHRKMIVATSRKQTKVDYSEIAAKSGSNCIHFTNDKTNDDGRTQLARDISGLQGWCIGLFSNNLAGSKFSYAPFSFVWSYSRLERLFLQSAFLFSMYFFIFWSFLQFLFNSFSSSLLFPERETLDYMFNITKYI